MAIMLLCKAKKVRHQCGLATRAIRLLISRAGFPQAMSEWRLLTGFLRREPLKDAAFAEELRTRITKLASRLEKAFSPWKLPSKSSEARSKSLTGILGERDPPHVLLRLG